MQEPSRRSTGKPNGGSAAAEASLVAWALEPLAARLQPLRPGLTLALLAETDSTSTRLLERARAGDAGPCLLVAERQTAGRGRLGRPWFSDAPAATDDGPPQLCFSLGLPFAPAAGWSGLSLAVGVALAEALHPSVRLKWPNDLWLVDGGDAGRKLGGVLIETLPLPAPGSAAAACRYAVVGIGINLAAPAARPGLDQPTAGWRELQAHARAPDLLARVAAPLLEALALFEARGFSAFAGRYAARDALAGRTVRTSDGIAEDGRADGVDAEGRLRLLGAGGGLRLLHSGEVSVRPC